VSWLWIVLLAAAAVLVVVVEWPAVSARFGADARRRKEREQRKATLRVVTSDDDEFVRSVQEDLDALPTTEEPRTTR
jgi:hypothetical protein